MAGGIGGSLQSILASILLATPFVLLFLFAGGGAADAKLMGALGAWLGLANCPMVLVTVTACGALLGIGCAIWKRQMTGVMANSLLIVWGLLPLLSGQRSWRQAQDAMPKPVGMLTIPYGLAILSGVCVAAAGTYAWYGAGL
jgi:Flp pilus assembly protein protease CpaA